MGLSTIPRTWVTGETVTAAELNVEVRDNLNAAGAARTPTTPTSTGTAGTATVATTETRDAVLGNYVFTAVAGHRYQAVFSGGALNASVANDLFSVRIRNGGAATPTAASALVGMNQFLCPVAASAGAGASSVIGTFVPGAGTQTLSVFAVRLSGTGVATFQGTRELYVIDLS